MRVLRYRLLVRGFILKLWMHFNDRVVFGTSKVAEVDCPLRYHLIVFYTDIVNVVRLPDPYCYAWKQCGITFVIASTTQFIYIVMQSLYGIVEEFRVPPR
ncbi:hypothetical protein RCL_jg20941.t1 [Rhizophagus clarus]|uniref:Uncharacterized protein n=1 Tax=Rhizophagus clarus TaxID=94130 RepID=A0A8H3QPU7_9GLOM|nr:hypothetical protein RCL_jg20941.t1 [Rhizophagus clarus]